MAETFKFEADPPAGTEVAATHVRLYESANGTTGWAVVDSVAIATLTPDDDGVYTWTSALADSAKYHQLVAALPIGDDEWLERAGAEVLPPRPVMPGTVRVYCRTIDAGLGIAAGVAFSVATKGTFAVAGDALVVKNRSVETDDTGYAVLELPADSGIMRLSLGTIPKTIDTTDRAGQTINFKDLP